MRVSAPAGPRQADRRSSRGAPETLSSLCNRRRWSTAKAHRLLRSAALSDGESIAYLDAARRLHTLRSVMALWQTHDIGGQSFCFVGAAHPAAGEA
jgi:hypothetical protein